MSDKEKTLVSAPQLAKAMNITTMAVGKYVASGMPVAALSGMGKRRFDLAACTQWRADSVKDYGSNQIKKGGRKPRPPKDGTAKEDQAPESVVPDTVADALLSGDLSLDSAESILKNWSTGKVVPAKAKALFDTVKAARERVRLDEEMGLLVRKEDVRTEFGEHLRAVRVNFEGLPNVAYARIRDVLKLTDAQAAQVRAELERIVRSVMRGIAESPFLAGKKKAG
ncbi:MAG TPA: hypothetical protein PKW63_01525 [Vicinamibacterales bacterium]|nr:hypothetical protein [Vicinamibacterales bacterium]